MREYIMSKVSRQLTVAVIASLALACALYFCMQPILDRAICNYYDAHPRITQEQTIGALSSLQKYATDNGIDAGDEAQLTQWMKQQQLTVLHVYRDHLLLYDSTQSHASKLHTHTVTHSYTASHDSAYPIVFADGVASVSVVVFPEYGVIQTMNRVLLVVCGAIFLGILLLCIRRKLRFFTRLENEVLSIAGGALDGPITVQGQDEIARLALCNEEMRRSLVARLQQEEARQQESYEWVTALSHDLRTPLTMLTGYLEIMRRKNEDPQQEAYLLKASSKASQLKEMSDLLFACFTPGTVQQDACEPIAAQWLAEMMAEQAEALAGHGRTVEMQQLPSARLYAQPMALKRVIDNVFSNLGKYADPGSPIQVQAGTEGERYVLRVTSKVHDAVDTQSTGLGLGICKNLMGNMGGAIVAERQEDRFVYTLTWRLAQAEETL